MPGTSPPYYVLTPPVGDTTSNRPTPVSWTISTISTMINSSWQNISVTGGTINGATIGATTPSTAKFTTLSTSGAVSFQVIPTTLTASAGDNTQNLATTSFVYNAFSNLITRSDTSPTASNYTPFWFNTTDGQMYVYYGSAWVTTANFSGGNGYVTSTGGTMLNGTIDGTVIGGTTPAAATITSLNGGALAGFRNRIINGGMQVDQRWEGVQINNLSASVAYHVDRWIIYGSAASLFSSQRTTPSLSGSPFAVTLTSLASTSLASGTLAWFGQRIEGINIGDLAYGTSNAKTSTVSFQYLASIAGTYNVSLFNAAQNRSYVATFTIPTASVWTPISLTIPGDIAGTWSNSIATTGLCLVFNLGSGTTYQTSTINTWQSGLYMTTPSCTSMIATSGASIQVTNVQLEIGPVATPFEIRPYSTQLILCQRYFEKSYDRGYRSGSVNANGFELNFVAYSASATYSCNFGIRYKVHKMLAPTMVSYSNASGNSGKIYDGSNSTDINASFGSIGFNGCYINGTMSASQTTMNMQFHWTATAEL